MAGTMISTTVLSPMPSTRRKPASSWLVLSRDSVGRMASEIAAATIPSVNWISVVAVAI